MADDALHAAKCDGPKLFALLGIEKPGPHCRCPFHEDHSPSMSVWQADSGEWAYSCKACSAGGSIVDAYSTINGSSTGDTIKAVLREATSTLMLSEPPDADADPNKYQEKSNEKPNTKSGAKANASTIPPRPDSRRLDNLIAASVAHLAAHPELFGIGTKRGLTAEVCGRFQVGHLPALTFREWGSRELCDTWILPILLPDGSDYCAIKLHSDNPGRAPKCGWAPFGTMPFEKPRHGMNTWFPHPAELLAPVATGHGPSVPSSAIRAGHPWEVAAGDGREIYICPGELKALAIMSAGWPALSLTGGEAAKVTKEMIATFAPLTGRRLVLLYDDDEAGQKWRDRMNIELSAVAESVHTRTFGTKEVSE